MHLEGIVAKRKRCSIVGTLFNDNLKLAIEREDGCWVAPLYGLGLFGEKPFKGCSLPRRSAGMQRNLLELEGLSN